MTGWRRWSWGLLAGLFAAGTASAQSSADTLHWSATLSYNTQQIAPSPAEAYWHTVTLGLGRRLPAASILLQGLLTRRFDITDEAFVADVYHDLWSGAYGNVRAAVAPGAEVLSRVDVGGELFQGVGAHEISASVRHQRFEVAEVTTVGAGSGHYLGRWYLRPRLLVANVEESWSPFVATTARRYLGGNPDNLVDLSFGLGEEVLEVAPTAAGEGALDVITSGSRFVGLRVQRFLGPRFGATLGGSYSAYQEIPNRWGASVGLVARW